MSEIVLKRNSYGLPVLWKCSECGKPFDLGWGSMCNKCIADERRHKELIQAISQQTKKEQK